MGTQTFTATPVRWTARPATLGAYVLSLALGAGIGWTAHVPSTAPSAAVAAATGQPGIVSSPVSAARADQAKGSTSVPHRLVLLLPGDGAFVSSSRLAIAGMAYSRPHGVRIRTVAAELFVAGRLVSRADIEVSSSRFAGFLDLPASMTATDGELRISDPTRQATPMVVQQIRLDIG